MKKQGFDIYFEGLIAGQLGVVHVIKVAEEVKDVIVPLVGESEMRFGGSLYAQFQKYDIHSPLEQVFYGVWEYIRKTYYQDFWKPESRFFGRFCLRPQFTVYRDKKPSEPDGHGYEAYLAHLDAVQSVKVYRLDFAVAELDVKALFESEKDYTYKERERHKDVYCLRDIGIECDSYEYHSKNVSPEQHVRQIERDRFLTFRGWRLFRFSGREIMSDPFDCVRQVHNYLLHAAGKDTVEIPKHHYVYSPRRKTDFES